MSVGTNKWFIFGTMVALQAADWVTTFLFRNNVHIAELNPLFSLNGHPQMFVIAGFKVFGLIIWGSYLADTKRLWIYWTTIGIMLAIVINNLHYLNLYWN